MTTSPKRRVLGLACAASGGLGVGAGVLTIVWPPAVADDVWSYPFPYGVGLALGVALAIVHVMTLGGLVAVRSLGQRRAATLGLSAAIAGLAALAVAEAAGGVIGDQRTDSTSAQTIGALFGVVSLLLAAGSITAGLVLVRARRRRSLGWPILLSGLTLLGVVTPANIIGNLPFRMAALMLWSAFFVALGAALARKPGLARPPAESDRTVSAAAAPAR